MTARLSTRFWIHVPPAVVLNAWIVISAWGCSAMNVRSYSRLSIGQYWLIGVWRSIVTTFVEASEGRTSSVAASRPKSLRFMGGSPTDTPESVLKSGKTAPSFLLESHPRMLLLPAALLGLWLAAPPAERVSAEAAVKAAVEKGDVDAAVAALRSAATELEGGAKTDPGDGAHGLDDRAGMVLGLSPDAARAAAEAGRAWRERAFTPTGAEVAKSWSLLATIEYASGDWKRAEEDARKALAIQKSADDLENLAVILMSQGRLADAEPMFVEAVGLRRGAAEPAKLAETLNAYAELLRRRDRTDAAAKTFDDAIAIATPLAENDPLLLARLETNSAGLAKDRGRLGDAEEGVRRSIAVKEKAAAAGARAG